MDAIGRVAGKDHWKVIALAMVLGISPHLPSASADDGVHSGIHQAKQDRKARHKGLGWGTLGYGPPGPQPGYQGFGLSFHPGYGYGGDALGPGADGGQPYYGGPGYPHPAPLLQRIGGNIPFANDPGPGFPSPEHPNFFGGVGPLVVDRPVISIGNESDSDPGYGCFTGALPYPASYFAPFVADSTSGKTENRPTLVSANGPGINKTPDASLIAAAAIEPVRILGIDMIPGVDPEGVRGLSITRVYPGMAAEKAGLHVGDVIHSGNGYVTIERENLEWIKANAAPDKILRLIVRAASDGKTYTFSARLP